MFTIVISEKGGAERREGFDKNEINVGRVQGNDLTLSKGNVSKHHARLLFRDSRFIVTDLKSTNGTYVNGRKISQATIVREGDKIYIGDFVLRLEATAPDLVADRESASRGDFSPARASVEPPPPGDASATSPPGAVHHVGPPPLPLPSLPAGASAQASAAASVQGAGSLRVGSGPPLIPAPSSLPFGGRGSEVDSVSHFPLERDPDDSEEAPELRGAPQPRFPGLPQIPQQSARVPSGTAVLGRAASTRGTLPGPTPPPAAPRLSATRSSSPPAGRPVLRDTSQHAARRLALVTLVDRVADVLDLAPLTIAPIVSDTLTQSIERAVRDQAKAMRTEGEVPEGLDLDLLARDALREMVDLGPIGPLIDDEETSEIQVCRPDAVLAMRNGQMMMTEVSFTSESALARVIGRLVQQSGEPLHAGELAIERRLARGARMVAIAPPAASSWVLVVRKRRRVESSLEELVRSGAMSTGMAAFLEACVAGRANVLVAGPGDVLSSVLSALASAAVTGERIVVLQDAEEIATGHAQVVSLALVDRGARGEQFVHSAARMGADHLVIASLAGAMAVATVDVIGEGSEGVLAGVRSPSLRHGLARLVAQLALARPGASVEAAREALGESFDVALEVTRAGDGTARVARIAELGGADAKGIVVRDLFVVRADAGGESGFAATGTTPRLSYELAARGIKLDLGIFRRR